METDIARSEQAAIGSKSNFFTDWQIICLLIIGAIVLNLLWFSFDYHFPTQDEAEHIMNSLAAMDLLRHFHPWNYHWWYQVLTINCFYPPVAYMVNGFFMLIFGQSRLTEQISLTFFLCVAISSCYGVVRLLKGSRLAAGLSACCLASYPLVTILSHTFFLDLPELAMTTLSLMTLLWWRSFQTLDWKRTLLTAFVLGISCLTKQLVAAFILPVGLYLLFDYADLIHAFKKPRWHWLSHLLAMGMLTVAMGLPFILINYKLTHNMTSMLMGDFALKNVQWSYLDRLRTYLPIIPGVMSPWLFSIFVISVIASKREQNFRLLPISLSAIGGFLLMLAWPANAADPRYLIPVLIAPAIYTGFLLDKLFYLGIGANSDIKSGDKPDVKSAPESHGNSDAKSSSESGRTGNKFKLVTAVFIVVVSFLQYVYINFVPYPLPLPKLPIEFYKSIAQNDATPTPLVDWGHNLVIDTINKTDGAKTVYLNVLTNQGSLHAHAFELLLKEKGNHSIKPTTTRLFTVFGDKVEFNPQVALQCQWYLWKTGSVGYNFFDKQSADNFNKLVNFIRNSGKYKLMAQKDLPDGSQLMLYRLR